MTEQTENIEEQDLSALLESIVNKQFEEEQASAEDGVESPREMPFKGLFDSFFNATIIKVKYHEGATPLHMIDVGDWCDLYTAEEVTLKAGESTLISLGISMQLPENHEAIIAPRSSTFIKWGILQTNSIGVIDSSYCGDNDIWKMSVYATRDVTIPAGTRLCQFRVQECQPRLSFVAVNTLGNEDRNGFGSTGD